jgi:hypothetical protein
LAIVSTILIVATQSALLAALLYYVPLEFGGIRLSGLLITVGLAFVIGLYHLVRHTLGAIRPAHVEVDAISVLPGEQPGMWQLATSVARELGAPLPDNILLGLEPITLLPSHASKWMAARRKDTPYIFPFPLRA